MREVENPRNEGGEKGTRKSGKRAREGMGMTVSGREKQEEKEGNSLKAAELTLHVAARHTILYAVMK